MIFSKSNSVSSFFLIPEISISSIIGFSDKFRVSTSFGLVFLNSEQKGFILDKGSLLTVGFEYGVTENLTLAINKSYYNLFEKTYPSSSNIPSTPFIESNFGASIDLDNTTLDMKYEKIGISIIYGFKTK